MSDFTGKAALVTGGASGIGAATAKRLAEAGAEVFIGDLDVENGEAVSAQVGGEFVHLDVTDRASWSDTLQHISGRRDGLDLLHLNAGVMLRPRGEAMGDDPLPWIEGRYDTVRAVNLDGVVYGTMAALPYMATRAGSIAVTASIAGLIEMPQDPVYALTKHAVVGFVRSMGPLLAESGMTINAVCPGGVDTGLVPPDLRTRMATDLMDAAVIAGVVVTALESSGSGEIWVARFASDDPWRYEFAPVH